MNVEPAMEMNVETTMEMNAKPSEVESWKSQTY